MATNWQPNFLMINQTWSGKGPDWSARMLLVPGSKLRMNKQPASQLMQNVSWREGRHHGEGKTHVLGEELLSGQLAAVDADGCAARLLQVPTPACRLLISILSSGHDTQQAVTMSAEHRAALVNLHVDMSLLSLHQSSLQVAWSGRAEVLQIVLQTSPGSEHMLCNGLRCHSLSAPHAAARQAVHTGCM